MIDYVAKCASGRGTLAEALFGVMFLGGFLVGCALALVVQAIRLLAGSELGVAALFAADVGCCAFSLFAGFCVWRCALNFRYRVVGMVVRGMVAAFSLLVVARVVLLSTGQLSSD